ncbi:hypothetical protein K2Y11_16625 [bacterium]|nr:hypothetical protein [bacterium]
MNTLRMTIAALGLLVAFAAPSHAALITYDLTFDEFINTPVPVPPGLQINEPDGAFTTVSYFGGTEATYGFGSGLSIFPNITTPFLEGTANGTVIFSFSSPVSNFNFDIGLITFFDVPNDYTVTVFKTGVVGPADTIPVNATAVGFLPYDHFTYSDATADITGFTVMFNSSITSFAIDNLFASNAVVPEASTLVLGSIAMLGMGVIGYRRRRSA